MTSLPVIRPADAIAEDEPAPTFDALLSIPGRNKFRVLRMHMEGQEYKIPKNVTLLSEDHVLVLAVGWKAARDLVDEFGGILLYVPVLDVRAISNEKRYIVLMRGGLCNHAISQEMGVSVRHVRRMLSRCGLKNPNRSEDYTRNRLLKLRDEESRYARNGNRPSRCAAR